MKKEDNVFFVGVKHPVEVRRTILETSRQTIASMQRFEAFKQIREEKQKQISLLKKNLSEISKLVNNFRSELPKTPLRASHDSKIKSYSEEEVKAKLTKKTSKAKLTREEKKKVKEYRKEQTELQRLEEELAEIESKLKDIS